MEKDQIETILNSNCNDVEPNGVLTNHIEENIKSQAQESYQGLNAQPVTQESYQGLNAQPVTQELHQGLNAQPSAQRVYIGFFGMRNAGKSSVVNVVTGQALSLVSDTKGTTTDPVKKTMELLPIGPVVIIDTPGIDDDGDLGKLRVERALSVLNEIDVGVLVVDGTVGIREYDKDIINNFRKRKIPYIVAINKKDVINKKDIISKKYTINNNGLICDEGTSEKSDKKVLSNLAEIGDEESLSNLNEIGDKKVLKNWGETGDKEVIQNLIYVSAKENENIYRLKELIGKVATKGQKDKKILEGLIDKDDIVVLVVPIDESAPKNRLILPQQMVLREILDTHATSIVTQVEQLETTLNTLKKSPKLVITDSQAFNRVAKIVPQDIELTSFSILLARFKGILSEAVKGAEYIEKLQDDDTVLISEGCTHHRQCNDIGTVKLPNWIKKYTGKNLNFKFTSGGEFPADLSKYALVIHCGGCMLNEKNVTARYEMAKDQNIPISNYGITISYLNGILTRGVNMFPEIKKEKSSKWQLKEEKFP